MSSFLPEEEFFEELARDAPGDAGSASSMLKARVYSALVEEQQESGRLLNFGETKQAGRKLCVFEELVRITRLGESAQTLQLLQRVPCPRVGGEFRTGSDSLGELPLCSISEEAVSMNRGFIIPP